MEMSIKLLPHAASLHEPIENSHLLLLVLRIPAGAEVSTCGYPVVNRSRMERHTGTKAENGNVQIKEDFGKKKKKVR